MGQNAAGTATIVLWLSVRIAVGTLRVLTWVRDSTAADLLLWVAVGTGGFGVLSVVFLLRTRSGKPLVQVSLSALGA